jgi:hypothetical protein
MCAPLLCVSLLHRKKKQCPSTPAPPGRRGTGRAGVGVAVEEKQGRWAAPGPRRRSGGVGGPAGGGWRRGGGGGGAWVEWAKVDRRAKVEERGAGVEAQKGQGGKNFRTVPVSLPSAQPHPSLML